MLELPDRKATVAGFSTLHVCRAQPLDTRCEHHLEGCVRLQAALPPHKRPANVTVSESNSVPPEAAASPGSSLPRDARPLSIGDEATLAKESKEPANPLSAPAHDQAGSLLQLVTLESPHV